ncbi:MAG: hypothetical protein KGY76_09285 [Candidatus Thermoplasmatota archaeon]|nr:hypothetical protein [Candidatus Thermoplasmatota archaeon]
MKNWKKALIFTVSLVLIITSIQSALYTSVSTESNLTISTRYSDLQLAANRTDFSTGEYLLQNESGNYQLDLGSFVEGTHTTYVNTFALVNSQDTGIEVTNISVETNGGYSPYVRVWLHQDSSLPCPSEEISGVKTETTGGDWGNLSTSDTAQLYYDGTNSGRWRWPASNGDGNRFLLKGSENGYSSDKLNLNNGGHFGWNSSQRVWSGKDGTENEVGSAISSAEGLSGGDPNWIWVQIDVIVPEDAGEQSISGTLYLYTKSF